MLNFQAKKKNENIYELKNLSCKIVLEIFLVGEKSIFEFDYEFGLVADLLNAKLI